MKKLTIQFADSTIEARSEANMWTHLRSIRDSLGGKVAEDTPHATVTAEDGTLFKDIVFKMVKDKIQMVNLVKETCRRQVEKARKAAKEKAEKEAARKAKKREADRRYRARKKAEKAAADGAVEIVEETVAQPQMA